MRRAAQLPYVERMDTQIVSDPVHPGSPPQDQAWESSARQPSSRADARVPVLAVATAGALALLSVAAAMLPQPHPAATGVGIDVAAETAAERPPATPGERRAPGACGGTCEFSSAGSAELHAFDHGEEGVLHVLHLEARWTQPKLRKLRGRAEAWQQAMTVHLFHDQDAGSVVMDHWSSDLPSARVATNESTGSVTIAVTVDRLEKLRPGRLYRTQVLLRSPRDLDGAVWHSTEHVGQTVAVGGERRFQAEQSSTPRRGISGWCPQCYATWDLDGSTAG